MNAIRVASAAILFSCALASAAAQGGRLGVDLFAGTPSARADVFRSAFPGLSLRYIASPNFELSLDYAFMETEYYYPESGSGPWTGPVQWSSMPDGFSGMRSSWIFYHTKHFISPVAWYIAPLESYGAPFAVRVGAGPALSLIVPNESTKYYPGLSDAFDQFKQSFKAYLGLSFRLGLEYRPARFARIGLEYLFVVDSLMDAATAAARLGFDYFDRAGNLLVFAGFRL